MFDSRLLLLRMCFFSVFCLMLQKWNAPVVYHQVHLITSYEYAKTSSLAVTADASSEVNLST